MNPGDVFARATGVYAIVALVGRTAAVVPIRAGRKTGPRMRGDIVLAEGCGVAMKHNPVARCWSRMPMQIGAERVVGVLSVVELAAVHREIRRANESAYDRPGRPAVSFDAPAMARG